MFDWIKRRQIARYEQAALREADARGIGEQGTRGEDDARDAFRHAYISASIMHEYSIQGVRPIGSAIIHYFGNQIEIDTNLSSCPITMQHIQSAEMDIINNKLGANYALLDGDPADYAQRLLEEGVLISSPEEAPEIPWVRAKAADQERHCEALHAATR